MVKYCTTLSNISAANTLPPNGTNYVKFRTKHRCFVTAPCYCNSYFHQQLNLTEADVSKQCRYV